jgi:hypothetical protein
MLLASPNFERNLDTYLGSPDRGLNRRLRLAERSTLLYLLRTACKTSPFSTLTAVAHGRFEGVDSGASPERPLFVPNMEKKSVSRLNVAVLSRVSVALLACRKLLDFLPLQLKPDCRLEGNRVRFSRRMVTFLDDAEPLTMSVKEASFQLPLSATLGALYDMMNGGCELSMRQLAELLAAKSGAGLKEIEDLLRVFVGLDLLFAPPLRPVLDSINPAEHYCEKLESLDIRRLGPALELLRGASKSANLYGASSLSERPRLLQEIGRQLTGVFEQMGAPAAPLPPTLVYEDCTVGSGPFPANEIEWRSMGGSLAVFQRLLPLFDTMLPPRMAMKGVFRIMWGEGRRCDDVRAFAELFYQDYHAPYWRAQSNGGITDESGNLRPALNVFHSPEITLIDRGRQEFADYLRRRAAEDAGAHEITLSSEALLQIAARLPATVPALQSHSFFAQPALTADGPRLVLNNVYGGLTQMMSRFVHLFEASGNACFYKGLASTLEAIQPPDAIFAEILGGHDNNLNLHPPLTRYELVMPGEQSARAPEDQIAVDDLCLEHDASSDVLRLSSKRLRREIIPVYLGFLVPIFLPELQQVLCNFSSPGFSLSVSLWAGVKGSSNAEGIEFFPRLRLDSVVLERATWHVPAALIPHREDARSDADWFLRVARWRRQHGFPQHVFVRPGRTQSDENDADADGGAIRLMRKPMYVDFDNYFTLSLLDRLASTFRGRLIFAEMLPTAEQAWVRDSGGAYVSELLLELNSTERVENREQTLAQYSYLL